MGEPALPAFAEKDNGNALEESPNAIDVPEPDPILDPPPPSRKETAIQAAVQTASKAVTASPDTGHMSTQTSPPVRHEIANQTVAPLNCKLCKGFFYNEADFIDHQQHHKIQRQPLKRKTVTEEPLPSKKILSRGTKRKVEQVPYLEEDSESPEETVRAQKPKASKLKVKFDKGQSKILDKTSNAKQEIVERLLDAKATVKAIKKKAKPKKVIAKKKNIGTVGLRTSRQQKKKSLAFDKWMD